MNFSQSKIAQWLFTLLTNLIAYITPLDYNSMILSNNLYYNDLNSLFDGCVNKKYCKNGL